MKSIGLFYRVKINIAKIIMFSCIFLFGFLVSNGVSVDAAPTYTINSSTYTGNGNNNSVVNINGISYIQGSGNRNQDGITFTLENMYNSYNDGFGYRAFALWESGFSSGLDSADYDRWYIEYVECDSCDLNTLFASRTDIARYYEEGVNQGKVVTYNDTTRGKVWYIRMETQYYQEGSSTVAPTKAVFDEFFTDGKITYTYRIRNVNKLNGLSGFGYKRIYINFWESADGSGTPIQPDPVSIEFGLARAISDVGAYTNNSGNYYRPDHLLDCSLHKDVICVDYVDLNGSTITAEPATTNVYLPTDILYSHASQTNEYVQGKLGNVAGTLVSETLENEIKEGNTTFAYNYFCEGTSITPATITHTGALHSASCGSGMGSLRKYVYVNASLVGDLDSDDITVNDFEAVYLNTTFRTDTYKVSMTVDSRGNYVFVIRDMFDNVNEVAVAKIMDILNQSIIVYFEKSNKTSDTVTLADGWKANELVTNEDVIVTLTMIASTVIEKGFPITAATTTELDQSHVKKVEYWRVTGSEAENDVCGADETDCAKKPGDSSRIIVLYSKNQSTGDVSTHPSYNDFDGNRLSVKISSNGRYRFYIETFAVKADQNHTQTSTTKGEQRNPRVEVYKIDKNAPQILFGGSNDTNCPSGNCSYVENTYDYYQGTGNRNGSILENLVDDPNASEFKIVYTQNGIYYVSANGGNSLLASAATGADKFFEYIDALVNSGVYLKENILKYDDALLEYSNFSITGLNSVTNNYTALATTIKGKSEQEYREYVIANDIKYIAYNLATVSGVGTAANLYNLEVVYLDATQINMTVCEALGSSKIDYDNNRVVDQSECVNYYLDHGMDFKIKIIAKDIVQNLADDGQTDVLANIAERVIYVDVQDNTAPGFSSIINNYNVGSKCRIELGNTIGVDKQKQNNILKCYGILNESNDVNAEDNAFGNVTVHLYMLSLEEKKWISLKDGEEGYTPNRSGNYAMLVIISDNSSDTATTNFVFNDTYHDVAVNETVSVTGNAIATVVSYYVDKKIVLITPQDNEKYYGDADPIFEYSIAINQNNENIDEYLAAPFKNMDLFTTIATTTNGGTITEAEKQLLFKGNAAIDGFGFSGKLNRQESADYNGVEDSDNEYVGIYKIVLGSLNITGEAEDGYDLGEDYIIKINPNVRNGEEYQLRTIDGTHRLADGYVNKSSLVISQQCNNKDICKDHVEDGIIKANGDMFYNFTEDDDYYVESTVLFTIKQVILTVTANGANKDYGEADPGYSNYNNDENGNLYLGGYTISGFKFEDSNRAYSIVLGVLRREVGEHAGSYIICNYRGLINDNVLESTNNMLVMDAGSGDYSTCGDLKDEFANVVIKAEDERDYVNGIIVGGSSEEQDKINEYNNFIRSRALYIETNKTVGYTKTLNVTTDIRNNNYANYVISYVSSELVINPITLVVQPTPGQRREYSYNGVDEVDPWELVVYGTKEFAKANSGFNGYTDNSPIYTAGENDPKSVDTEGEFTGLTEFYNNKSEDRDTWTLILAGTTYTGFKTNETYSLFDDGSGIGLLGKNAESGLYKNMNAGWYDFASLGATSTLAVISNERGQCGSGNVVLDGTGTVDCKNYNLVLDLDYRNEDGYKNGDTDASGNTVEVVYKSKLGYCKTTDTFGTAGDVGVQCSDAQSSKILFEVYRREIILEFNSTLELIGSDPIVYGQRYGYYKDNLFKIDDSNKSSVDGSIFYCYATYDDGVVGSTGACATSKWYGLTEGDDWKRVGLTFKLHSLVEQEHTNEGQTPIPAGRYYVYSSITDTDNYKYNYLGGTLTIKTKVVNIEAHSYSKEYGNVYYKAQTCLKDGDLLNSKSSLVTINEGCSDYGFDVKVMDEVDTINDNFTGRPKRESTLANTNGIYTDTNGLQENVGIYPINIGSIHAKHNNSYHANNACSDNFLATSDSCVVVSGVTINNYITINDNVDDYNLTYYIHNGKTKGEDGSVDYATNATEAVVNATSRSYMPGTVTITPATIEIKVTPGQTKMYGCAYNKENTAESYSYSYASGYDCVSDGGSNYDLGYGYTVTGDKDYYIFNNGYYETDYDKSTTYSVSEIGQLANGVYGSGTGANLSTNRNTALNGGVLYRISINDLENGKITYSSLKGAANSAQAGTTYQRQAAGNYIITLGNLNASLTSDYNTHNDTYSKVCGEDNLPGNGTETCRNYIIEYYGNTSVSEEHSYETSNKDYIFEITPRYAFVYVDYNTKVYGNDDPDITYTCVGEDSVNGFCNPNDLMNFGISRYYTKSNSLATLPWVSSNESGEGIAFASASRGDMQVDIIAGEIDRYGVNKDTTKTKDDPVGDYHYKFSGLGNTEYSTGNYLFNYYYRTLVDDKIQIVNGIITNAIIKDGDFEQAVYSDGTNTQTLDQGNTDPDDDEVKNVVFEIALRKLSLTLIDFAKVYGIQDNAMFFEFGACATNDQTLVFDEEGNPKCQGGSDSEHGLSPTHKSQLLNGDGTLKQDAFRTLFGITFYRALGENVLVAGATCRAKEVTITVEGHFPDKETSKTFTLGCEDSGYKVVGVVDQDPGKVGYNYEITYVDDGGVMTILQRTLKVTPDSGQGFQYGSYTQGALIPAIKYTTSAGSVDGYRSMTQKIISLDENGNVVVIGRGDSGIINDETGLTTTNYGLVHGDNARICLNNIDGTHAFCINDRQDVYDVDKTEMSLGSGYSVNDKGEVTDAAPTYVFGDMYKNQTGDRSALNRELKGSTTRVDERYNRNVAIYVINRGDLLDKSGNYDIEFVSGVEYVITKATVTITPLSNQFKIYGESDKELKFTVTTKFRVNTSQYILYDSSIVSVGGDTNFIKDANNMVFVEKDSEIVLSGYAYYENSDVENYNYGIAKESIKEAFVSEAITQSDIEGNSYDKYCYDNYTDNSDVTKGTISGCSNQKVSFASTSLVIVGYLHLNNYIQSVGNHEIIKGMVVADNEFDEQNYELNVASGVTFEIKQLDIETEILAISKLYGNATDAYKCDAGVSYEDCLAGLEANLLQAIDNENRMEYNFDIYLKGGASKIGITGDKVLMVNAINGNYYTQTAAAEDKNNHLGIMVIRKTNNNAGCTIGTDTFGCEDVGEYNLVFRKYQVTDNVDANYKLWIKGVGGQIEIESVTVGDYKVVDLSNNTIATLTELKVIKGYTNVLTISKRPVDIFVNTNLNTTIVNYYQIEQNIEAPKLPVVDNSYNLLGYAYDPSKGYHTIGEQASSTSTSADLDSTYGKVVWGGHPLQVRTSDALVGEVGYCNQPTDGSKYESALGTVGYPASMDDVSNGCANLVYNANKAVVNTNTSNKYVMIARNASEGNGLKIVANYSMTNVSGNTYEDKNYNVTFYPGAIKVVGDSSLPVLSVGNKDYYIEANAMVNASGIIGSYGSVGTILEYLFNGTDTNMILAQVSADNSSLGNLYIVDSNDQRILINQAGLFDNYGLGSESYQGIVSGIEQEGVYPFVSDYPNSLKSTTYLNEVNITSLKELIITFVKWFNVTSYDQGQYINGEYLERKFDKYYYVAINKHGYDIGADLVDNEFAINKVGTYEVSFYVMDNAGQVSLDGNTGRLHIIDTTKPDGGELNLYNYKVQCDTNCDNKEQWYISSGNIRLSAFNRYSLDESSGEYYLDSAGEYIYFAEVGSVTYRTIESLKEDNIIKRINYIDYVDTTSTKYSTSAKYSANGIIHYAWASNPDGIYMTITGAKDNSYIDYEEHISQWSPYYSVDGGNYWLEYALSNNMEAYSVLTNDGYRVIKSMVMDSGVNKVATSNTNYSINYKACYQGCAPIEVLNKVTIDAIEYEFGENDIVNSYFDYDENTVCSVNKANTLVTCVETVNGSSTNHRIPLYGNKFTYKGVNYVLIGDGVFDQSRRYHTALHKESVTINGITYMFDRGSMTLTRYHIGTLGPRDDNGVQILTLKGIEYELITTVTESEDDNGNKVRNTTTTLHVLGESEPVTEYDTDNATFTLDGLTYIYVEDPSGEKYYRAIETYNVYQDEFKINGTTYSISSTFGAGNTYTLDGDTLILARESKYSDTYKMYDRYLIGNMKEYTNSPAVESLAFRYNMTLNNGWNESVEDIEGAINEEVSAYLNKALDTKYKKHSKTAYLDTKAPQVGINITNVQGNNVKYGEDWSVYESGYYNELTLSNNKKYALLGNEYVIDIVNMKVTTKCNMTMINREECGAENDTVTYSITPTNSIDSTMKYVYTIYYTKYYINEDVTKIKWLNSYVEKYVGAQDIAKPGADNNYASESKAYNLNVSTKVEKVSEDLHQESILVGYNTTPGASGISASKYITSGIESVLYDFVDIRGYNNQSGIYYEDIEYIVWYEDENGVDVKEDMSEEFKACYIAGVVDAYGNVEHKITQDCAQAAIARVITHEHNLNRDVTYTINYIVKDKAGNASEYEARGVLYATISPRTNIVVNNIPAGVNNSPVSVEEVGNNTYNMQANQGVSLDLLNQAFSVSYSSSLVNYNKSAVMTIYREGEMIHENVKGVAFTDYVDSSQIGEYTIIYNMNSTYTTYLGQKIPVSGETVTLNLNIISPIISQDSESNIEEVMKNETSPILISLILGMIGIMGVALAIIIRKKNS